MTLEHKQHSAVEALMGNPGANIPGLSKLIRAVMHGYLDTGLLTALTDSGSVDENTLIVTQSGDGKTITIPQAVNAPGRVLIAKFSHANGGYVKDDFAAGARTIVDCTVGGVGVTLGIHVLYSTGDVNLGTYGWAVLSFNDTAA